MSALRDIGSAIRLLTVVPVPGAEGAHASRYFPYVGWLFAALGIGLGSGAVIIGRADGARALVVGTLVVGAWALLSGFMHLDGLADSADGLGVRGDAARRLEVMRASSIGAYGVIAVVLCLLVQATCMAAIIESRTWWALASAPVIARWGASVAVMLRPPARTDGLGARYASPARWPWLLVPTAALLPLALYGATLPRLLAFVAGLACAATVPSPFVRRIGGITGDTLGATIVVTETFVLLCGALVGGAL